MSKVVFVTERDADMGFGLAGLTQHAITSDGLEALLKELKEDPSVGVLVVDERLITDTDKGLRDFERKWRGTVVVLPSPEKLPEGVEDYALRIIRRAVGYHVRLGT